MALSAPALLSTVINNANQNVVTCADVEPTAGALLLASWAGQGSPTGLGITITDSFTGTGAWAHLLMEEDTGDSAYCAIAWALAGLSPGEGAITVTGTDNLFRQIITAGEVTGQNATPVPQSKKGGNALSTLSLVLDSGPAAGSMVFGAIQSRSGGVITPGDGFTELDDTGSTADTTRLQAQYDLTSPGDTMNWSDLNTLGNAAVLIEIAAAGAPSGFTPRSYPRGASRGVMRGAA